MKLMDRIIESSANREQLDKLGEPIMGAVHAVTKPRLIRNLLSGTPLGHPAHPLLTDLPIGAWGAATLLDLIGGKKAESAADLLVAAGAVAAVPTIASGLNDYGDTYGPEARIALTHGIVNTAGLGLFLCSLLARKRGKRRRGKLLGLIAFGTIAGGSYLGGHLSFGMGTNVNALAHEYGPEDWTPVLPEADLPDGEHRKVEADGVGVLLWKMNGRVTAISSTCSHMGGPLDEGTFDTATGCVTCPWHGSQFRVDDGAIVRGPATVPARKWDTRVVDGQIEVKPAA